MSYLRHDADGMTLACPECDSGQRWWLREDDTVRCRECKHECHREELVARSSQRGSNLDVELCRKGARNGPDYDSEHMRKVAQTAHGPRTGPLADSD